jgi:hypothetical protein
VASNPSCGSLAVCPWGGYLASLRVSCLLSKRRTSLGWNAECWDDWMRKQLWKRWSTGGKQPCRVTTHLPGAESLEEKEEREAPDDRRADDAQQGDELDPLPTPKLWV